ncbi:cytochrome b pre-mRNA-processing protein 3 [Methylocapsa palsarum]|uniref:Cytochrome b pre-mRNA-processing protein 3 n=2 Tax=Methylocapsa palsarum TaxID=1612308 RepID=A0A1I3Y889_9HYPH|nr:cytochrome b pre-mRNA-processing protein 3 [Methylocapsa palsarum]
MFPFYRKSANRAMIERLHGDIVAAARNPVLFTDYGIDDSLDGRFEAFTLLAALVLRRLNAIEAPGPDMAQDLADAVFRHFDAGLRESGVGDASVPKRMKTFTESFQGRAVAYDQALRSGHEALAVALTRNVLSNRPGGDRLARYAEAAAAALERAQIQAFTSGPVPFPDPAAF